MRSRSTNCLFCDDDLALDATQTQYRAFGRVDQRSEDLDSQLPQVADGERASRELGRGERSIAGALGKSARAGGELAQGELGNVANHRDHQAGLGVDGDADVDAAPNLDLIASSSGS